jgi:DNA-binding transcriptional MocR family regulator
VQPQVTAVARPGDTIAIESPPYFGLLHVVEALGLRALELPTDAQHGVDLAFLASALERKSVTACLFASSGGARTSGPGVVHIKITTCRWVTPALSRPTLARCAAANAVAHPAPEESAGHRPDAG